MKLSEIILEEFKSEMDITLRIFEAVPNAIFDFRAHEKSMSVSEIMNHMLLIPSWVEAILNNSELDWATYSPPQALTTQEELISTFKTYVEAGSKALQAIDDSILEKEWTMKKGDFTFFTVPKRTALRNLIINHTIHHRAQLGVNLRLNNLAVPATYVSSADDNLFS